MQEAKQFLSLLQPAQSVTAFNVCLDERREVGCQEASPACCLQAPRVLFRERERERDREGREGRAESLACHRQRQGARKLGF